MARVLTVEKELRAAVSTFQKNIRNNCQFRASEPFTFPGNPEVFIANIYVFRSTSKNLVIGIRPEDPRKKIFYHWFRLGDAHRSSDLELNIPIALNRRLNVCVVEQESDILICCRGKFTSYQDRIPQAFSLDYFSNRLIYVDDITADKKMIEVSSVSSKSLCSDLMGFTQKVKDLKESFKAGR